MRELKGYVKNNARPEGCIVQRYIDKECLTFCSMYLNDVDTIFNKVERNNEMVDFGGEISIFSCKGRPFGITEERVMSGTELGEIHTYILNNCPELKELENEHKAQLEAENNRNVNETHDKQFTYWLQQRVNDCQESSEIRVLSRGPLSMNRYSGCMVNGYRFHTKIREIDRKTQDSGIVVKGEYGEDIIDYYGILQEVLEVEYLGENKRVLVFKCDWFKVGDKKGLQVDRESAAISINMSRKWFKDQPYILASQAKQVFYVPDLKLGKHWYVVESSPPRKLFDVPVHEVYQEHKAHSSVILNYNVEPSLLTRGTILLELVDASTVRSSQKRHGIDEYSNDDEEIDPTNLEFSENGESLQEEYSDSGWRRVGLDKKGAYTRYMIIKKEAEVAEAVDSQSVACQVVSHTLIFCYIWAPTVLGKETRALGETRKIRLNKGSLVFEVDESFGRIIGKNSQGFITKGGCVMRKYAKLDGTTWKKQPDLLKTDIISKTTENSDFDFKCTRMRSAMSSQLGYHRNHQYKFASEDFQKISEKNKKNRSKNLVPPTVGTRSLARRVDESRREGKEFSEIEQYKMAHYSKKLKGMINEEADTIWNDLQAEEATSSCTSAEICLKKLGHLPGHIKGRSASTRNLGNCKLIDRC
ncbi:reverse transcriptase domain-containing protein [Tanacetum coccineum]